MAVPYIPADTTRSMSFTGEYGDRAGGRVSVRHFRTSRVKLEIQFRARVFVWIKLR